MPRKKRSASPFELMDDDFDDTSSQSSRNGNPPIQRNAANARERARMRVLSSAFGRLKTKLPNIPADTKLSKLDTLRLATMYIKQLKSVVEGGAQISNTNCDSSDNSSCSNLTNCFINLNSGTQSMNWPFGLHHHHFQHLSNTPTVRSNTSCTISSSLINTTNMNSFDNWCQSENNNNNNEQIKILRYSSSDNYTQGEQQKPHQQPFQSHTHLQHSILNHENSNHDQHHQHNHWYSETPSPDLDNSSCSYMTFENSHLLSHQEQHQNLNHHQHHPHVLTHLQPASLHSSSTLYAQHDFHNRQLQRLQHHNDQQQQSSNNHTSMQNGFTNASNLQSTSIR